MRPPVFIIGVPRSGTTLLRYMVNSGGRIYIPQESHFIPRFFGRHPQRPLTPDRVAHLLDVIRDDYIFFDKWRGPALQASDVWSAMEGPSPAQFLDVVFGRYAQQRGAVAWGDKTPIYTNHMELLDILFPRAQFVHLIRDARDVTLSTMDKWGDRRHVDVYFAARNWVDRTRHVEASTTRLGTHRVHLMKYEELIADPETQLRAMCEFLGEPYEDRMARPHLLGRQELRRKAFSAPVRRPPDASKIAGWRTKMPLNDQRLVQHVAGPTLRRYGYEVLDLGAMTPGQQLRIATLRGKYEAFHAGRAALRTAGLAHPN